MEWFSQFGNDICKAWLWLSAAFEFSTARRDRNHNIHNMAAPARQATAIPRFLLPQISWPARVSRPAALGALEQGRHRSCIASESRAAFPKSLPLQARTRTLWPKTSPQYASGHASALEFRRNFSATAQHSKDHHFDTLKFVQRLKEEGFTEEQAEGMMRVLGDVIEERQVTALLFKNGQLTCTASKTSHAPWSFVKTKRKPPTRRKSTLPNSAQSC